MSFFFPEWLFSKLVDYDSFNEAQRLALKKLFEKEKVKVIDCDSSHIKFEISIGRAVSNWNIMTGYDYGLLELQDKNNKKQARYQLMGWTTRLAFFISFLPILVLVGVTGQFYSFTAMYIGIFVMGIFIHFIRQRNYFNQIIRLLKNNA